MNRLALSFGFAIAALWSALVAADPPNEQADSDVVTIPLDQIWAYSMPGTRDVRELEPEVFGKEARAVPIDEQERRYRGSLVTQILRTLGPLPTKTETEPRQGFAVSGSGMDALRAAHGVLVEKSKSQHTFPVNDDITVVFLSYQSGSYVHLHELERHNNIIDVRYRFVPHMTTETSAHFALIPLGKLPEGKYVVKVTQSPMEKKFLSWGAKPLNPDWERRAICNPFNFSVEDRK